MSKSYFIPTRALTTQLRACEPCGETCHKGCTTNLEWCVAELKAQNTARGREVFVINEDGHGNVWLALKDKPPANWSVVGGKDA